MLASSTMGPATTEYTKIKEEAEDQECANLTPPPAASVSPKSADESHYTATSSPSSTINASTNNRNGNGSNNNGSNGSHSLACSSTTSSSGQMNMESPQSSTETSQRASFDFNSLFNNNSINNNNDKSSNFDFGGLQFGLPNGEMQQTPNPFGSAIPNFPLPGLDPAAIMQLSQMLTGSQSYVTFQQNSKQQLDAVLLRQQLEATKTQKTDVLPSLSKNSSIGPIHSPAQNESDRKRSYPYTFQYCVLCKKNVHSSKLPCHIRQCHVRMPMFKCPSCEFSSTYSKNNVKSHMVSLHSSSGEPISHMDQYAGQVEEYMKQCFPNVRGRGRPVHGRNSPRSPPISPIVNQQNGYESARNSLNGRQVGGRNQRQRNMNNLSAINNQMPAVNRLNEMIAMINSQKPNNEANDIMNQINPFAYLQKLNYMHPEFNMVTACARQKLNENLKVKQCKKEPEQMSMEQLLQNFGARLNVPYGQMESKPAIDENTPMQFESTEQKPSIMIEVENNESAFEPHYLPRNLKFWALGRNQTSSTIFSTFANNSVELIEQLDLSHEFESLINENASLLTKEQSEKVAEARTKLQLQAFEVMFAVHRLDLDVLPLQKLGVVMSIAPTEVDIHRFALFERSNNIRNLSQEEQFVVQLSKIERLHEKLAVMRLMGTFDQKVQKIGQQLHDLNTAAKLLHNSSEFHTIIQLLLSCANVVIGDLNYELISGFRISSIVDICAFKFPNGRSLLDLLASRIPSKFPELKSFASHYATIEAASNTNFSEAMSEIRRLEQAKQRVEAGLSAADANEALTEFLKRATAEINQLNESAQITKSQIQSTLEFFGEPIEPTNDKPLHPEHFFQKIAEFSRNFQSTLCCT